MAKAVDLKSFVTGSSPSSGGRVDMHCWWFLPWVLNSELRVDITWWMISKSTDNRVLTYTYTHTTNHMVHIFFRFLPHVSQIGWISCSLCQHLGKLVWVARVLVSSVLHFIVIIIKQTHYANEHQLPKCLLILLPMTWRSSRSSCHMIWISFS